MISDWAREEMAAADFGDARLDTRAASLLTTLGQYPNLSLPAACGGHAETQAAYRFFANDKVTLAQVLAPHIERTRERMAAQPMVLLVQDTTELDLTRPHQQVAGAGELDGARRGVLLHTMQAFTPNGTPLGTVWAETLNRVAGVSHAPATQKHQRRKRLPIEQKESLRWLTGLRQARQVAQTLPDTQCLCMADSEADIYEWFAEPRAQVDGLVRACQNRALAAPGAGEPPHVREQVLATPVLYEVELVLRGRQAKTAVETRQRRQNRPSRQAQVQVRAATLTLRPPARADRKLPPVAVNVVLVHEAHPPADEPAVEWILVTTLPITTPEQVRRVVEYYCVRWSIEVLFRTLKSGCRIEGRRFEDVTRVLPCLGLCLIVAWRTLFLCQLGRECPELDCQAVFEPVEWQAVWVAVKRQKLPPKNPRLRAMVRLIGRLGGYIERPGREPGPQTMWIGLQRMYDLAWAWEMFGPKGQIRSP
jgi:hypothetical protein